MGKAWGRGVNWRPQNGGRLGFVFRSVTETGNVLYIAMTESGLGGALTFSSSFLLCIHYLIMPWDCYHSCVNNTLILHVVTLGRKNKRNEQVFREIKWHRTPSERRLSVTWADTQSHESFQCISRPNKIKSNKQEITDANGLICMRKTLTKAGMSTCSNFTQRLQGIPCVWLREKCTAQGHAETVPLASVLHSHFCSSYVPGMAELVFWSMESLEIGDALP